MTHPLPGRFLLGAVLALAACSSSATHNPRGMIYSPLGEPLNGGALGTPSCEEARGAWFDHLSRTSARTGEGEISKASFMAAAAGFFVILDADHSGALNSAGLEAYRAPFRQDLASAPRRDDEARGTEKDGRGSKGRDRLKVPDAEPDPVMAADLNLDFRVTLQEYLAAMSKSYDELAKDKGVLTRGAILETCKNFNKRR